MSEEKDNNQNITEALEALTAIRETVRGNMQIVRPLFIDRRFGTLFMYMAVGCTVLTACLVAAELLWNNTVNAPEWAKIAFGVAGVLLLTVVSIAKQVIIDRAAKERDKTLNAMRFSTLPEVFNMFVDAIVTMILIIVLCIVIARATGNWWVFLPGLFLYTGIAFFLAANSIALYEYRILGMVSYAFTIIIVLFMKSHYELWLTGSFALFSYIDAFFFFIAAKRGDKELC